MDKTSATSGDTFVLDEDAVFLGEELATESDVFSFIGRKAQELGVTENGAALEAELKKREENLSTGLMDGFAIPHAKCSLVSRPTLFYIRAKDPVAWKMMEGSSAQYFFVMLVPEEDAGKVHLQMLSQIAVNLLEEDFRRQISQIETPHEMVDYLKEKLGLK